MSSSRRNLTFGVLVLAGLVLGAVLGFVAKQTDAAWLVTTLKTIGGVFTSLLQFTVPHLQPLILDPATGAVAGR